MDNTKTIVPNLSPIEGVDFNKLKVVIRTNWFWLALIFVTINAAAILYLRYTKDIFESESEVKLEVKKDATDLGIKSVVDDQNVNLISGEIEMIQSRLFLNRVLDSANLEVSYFSIGRVLTGELFGNLPFLVEYQIKNKSILNVPIYFSESNRNEFVLRFGNNDHQIKGYYNEPIITEAINLTIRKNERFMAGDEIDYYFIFNSRDVLLDNLLRNLTAEPLNYNANTLRIAFKNHNAFKAQYILNKIDTIYLQYSNEQKNLANRQKIDWLSNELSMIEKKMEGYEDYFENFTLQNKTNNLDEDLGKTIKLINQVDSQRYNLTQRISNIDQLLDVLQSERYSSSLPQRQTLPDRLNKNLDELQQLLLEQEKLKLSYSEITFAFREKQKEIETLREKSLGQLVEMKSESLKKLQQLNERKKKLEIEFANLPDKNTQFSKNLRFYKLNEQLYLMLMQSKSEFEVAQAGSTPDFKILSPASLPVTPIAPRKALIAGAAFVASIVCILGFIGVLYLLNNKITGLTELERMVDLPVLGVVPILRHHKEKGLIVVNHPKSMVSEAIRTLRTNLDFFNFQGKKKVIAVSSTVSGEGKSFIASNLGGTIALSKKKVILLDLDLRKPKSRVTVPLDEASKGISTILIGRNHWIDCIVHSQLENFHYIPAGPHPPNPSELLMNGEFASLLEDLKVHYDYVILDTPPVGLVTDGIMAMKNADLSIYVFRANYSKKDFLLNLKRIISINKFSNITMVLNALPSTGEQNYGYGYYEEPTRTSQWKELFKTSQ